MGGPVFSGASQLTCRLVLDTAVTVGANGVSGGSLTSVTLIVTSDRVGSAPAVPHPHRHRVARLLLVVQRRARPYLPAPTSTMMSNESRPSLPGCRSACRRRGRGPRRRLPTSVPGGVFSATLNVRERLENAGFLFATSGFGDPVPERDQSLCPSACRPHLHVVARARLSPVMIVLLSALFRWDHRKAGSRLAYCTS